MSPLSKPAALLPLGRSMAIVVLTFVAVVAAVFWMNNLQTRVLSAVRAYVNGEALYSKGQKDAVKHLLRFAHSEDRADYDRFVVALAVPLGDRQARIELERPQPDMERVRAGFLAGRNHAEDVDNLTMLFRRFRHIRFMARAIELWSEGDALVMGLQTQGEELRELVDAEPADSAAIGTKLQAINTLDEQLTAAEDSFSRVLGEANRWLERRLRQLSYAATAGLVLAGIGVSAIILRRVKHADLALSSQAEQWRVTLASIGDAVITTDTDGRVTDMNHSATALTGWTPVEAIGQPLTQVFCIVNEQTGLPAPNPVSRVLQDGVIVGLANHTVLITKSGARQAIDDSAAPIKDGEGHLIGCVLIFRDITERRRLEKEVAERLAAARLLAAIVTSSHDTIISKSLDGTIRTWNASAERLLGYSAEEAIGRNIALIIPSDRAGEEAEILARVRRGEPVDHFDTVRLRRDGTPIQVSLTISPIRDERGRVIGASKIMRDITEQKKAENRIHQLMTELTDADRRKDEFIAMLSHELRNPLSAIRNAVASAGLDEIARPRALEIARRQADQLGRLIDDLLDVTRITQGRIRLHTERVDLARMIEQAADSTRAFINARNLELHIEMSSAEAVHVEADPIRLQQVLASLLSNAAQFTDAGGMIQVLLDGREDQAVVRIRDTGIGIAPEMLPHVWDLFAQAERTLDRAQGGLGIGLTLARRLVELHGGRVEAFSAGLGKGAEFSVILSRLSPPLDNVHRGRASDHVAASQRPMQILVVEDNIDAAESLMMLLRLLGHHVRMASDGHAALEAVQVSKPDLMLVDIGLPGIDGYEVARRIRENPELHGIVLVALTGYGRDEDKQAALSAGFNFHVVKPVTIETIQGLVATLGAGAEAALPV